MTKSYAEVLDQWTDLSTEEKLGARSFADAEEGTPEATMTLAERQPRVGTPIPVGHAITAELQQIDQTGLNLIEFYEGLMLHAVWDPYGDVWTIGYGETYDVHQGEVWTQAQSQADLVNRIANDYEPAVRGLGVPLNQNQFDALCSFVWNVGPGSMSSSWTIGALLREREYTAAADAMLSYDRAGGVVLQGLVNRRHAERALFLTPPPPPPDPHHYSQFPIAEKFDKRMWNEREIVESYDILRKHGIANRKKLKPLRNDLQKLADHVYSVAHGEKDKDGKPSWDKFDRGWRFQELSKRANGKTVND